MSQASDPYVVCVGAATMDSIALVARHPRRDERVAAEDFTTAFGGPAATAAVTLARLGITTYFVGLVGDDAAGAAIVRELERDGVLAHVERIEGGRSAQSAILVDRTGGTRAIAAFPGALPPLTLDAQTLDLCRDAAWVHVDHAGYRAVAATAAELTLSVDAGNPIPDLDLRHVDLYAPSEPAIKRSFPRQSAEQAARKAASAGPRLVVVTRGARGSFAVDRAGPLVEAPSVRVEPVSTLGAGDVFHGALVAALTGHLPVMKALELANTAAALSCRAIDGRSAIPSLAELRSLVPVAADMAAH